MAWRSGCAASEVTGALRGFLAVAFGLERNLLWPGGSDVGTLSHLGWLRRTQAPQNHGHPPARCCQFPLNTHGSLRLVPHVHCRPFASVQFRPAQLPPPSRMSRRVTLGVCAGFGFGNFVVFRATQPASATISRAAKMKALLANSSRFEIMSPRFRFSMILFYLPPLLRLSSMHSIRQFSGTVLPPLFQGTMWSASICSMANCFWQTGQMPFCLS